MFIKDFISYFDIIFPLFILYLFFLLIAYIKNKNNKWIKTRNLVFFFFKLFIFINLYYIQFISLGVNSKSILLFLF